MLMTVKARLHQQQCRSNIVERYKLNDSFAGFGFGNNVKQVYRKI